MSTPRQRRFVRWNAALSLVSLAALSATGYLTLPVAVVAGLLCAVVAAQLTAPAFVRPPWRARLRWVFLAWAVVVVALALRHAAAVARVVSGSVT